MTGAQSAPAVSGERPDSRSAADKRASSPSLGPRLLRTTSKSADRPRADSCFVLAEPASEEAGPAHLVLVRRERLTPELGDARLRARKEERAAGAAHDRRRA